MAKILTSNSNVLKCRALLKIEKPGENIELYILLTSKFFFFCNRNTDVLLKNLKFKVSCKFMEVGMTVIQNKQTYLFYICIQYSVKDLNSKIIQTS